MVAGGGHPTHQWFGMYYAGQAGRRLPVPIFQAAEDFGVFLVLILIERRLDRWPDGSLRTGYPAGTVIGTAMVLWGIERALDEHLWLGEDGQLGSLLVQIAGVLLVVGGRRRAVPDPHGAGRSGDRPITHRMARGFRPTMPPGRVAWHGPILFCPSGVDPAALTVRWAAASVQATWGGVGWSHRRTLPLISGLLLSFRFGVDPNRARRWIGGSWPQPSL